MEKQKTDVDFTDYWEYNGTYYDLDWKLSEWKNQSGSACGMEEP